MVAQLFNAGIKGITLSEVFNVDRKVMRGWGRALKSGDPQTLVDALKGRGPRKLTPEVKAYLRMCFPIVYAEDKRSYSVRLRQEILNVFEHKICGETGAPTPSLLIFLLAHLGDPFNFDVVSRMVTKFIKAADIDSASSCHLIGHTCVTHMLEGGADIRYIQRLLGGEKLETSYYLIKTG